MQISRKYSGPSAPATHAAKIILKNFNLIEKPEGRIKATERNLAILIDVCTDIFRLEAVVDQFVKNTPWLSKDALARNLDQLREGIRAVEMVRNHLPRFANEGTQVPFSVKQGIEQEVTKEVQDNVLKLSKALNGAKTVEEEQRVLKAAGLVR